ncbi:hypothetical protein ACWC2T_45260 [Streptomyces sp. NPDC001393]
MAPLPADRISIAASTTPGHRPAPDRTSTTWAGFMPSQVDALLACAFIETDTLTGQGGYVTPSGEY